MKRLTYKFGLFLAMIFLVGFIVAGFGSFNNKKVVSDVEAQTLCARSGERCSTSIPCCTSNLQCVSGRCRVVTTTSTPTPTATNTPTPMPTASLYPVPNNPVPTGIYYSPTGPRAIRCSTADNSYYAEFTFTPSFVSLIGNTYTSKFYVQMTAASHPTLAYTMQNGYQTCACEQGAGEDTMDCNNNTLLTGICARCTWHDGTSSINPNFNPLQCPMTYNNYVTPLTNTYSFNGVAAPNLRQFTLTKSNVSACGSYQTDIAAGSYQTDIAAPSRVTVGSTVLNCNSGYAWMGWTVLRTYRDCPIPTPTYTPTPTRVPTGSSTPTPTRTSTPTPTYTPTPSVVTELPYYNFRLQHIRNQQTNQWHLRYRWDVVPALNPSPRVTSPIRYMQLMIQ